MSVEIKAVECKFGCDDLWKDIRCRLHASDALRQQWQDAMDGRIELPRVYGFRIVEAK